MGNIAGCNFACNGDINKGLSESQRSEEVCLMRGDMPIARSYAPPEGENSEDTPAHIQLTADCGNPHCSEQQEIYDINGEEKKVEDSSTPTQELDLGGGTGGEPMTNGPNNLFDDIVVPIGISTIVTKKPSLNQILVEELKDDQDQREQEYRIEIKEVFEQSQQHDSAIEKQDDPIFIQFEHTYKQQLIIQASPRNSSFLEQGQSQHSSHKNDSEEILESNNHTNDECQDDANKMIIQELINEIIEQIPADNAKILPSNEPKEQLYLNIIGSNFEEEVQQRDDVVITQSSVVEEIKQDMADYTPRHQHLIGEVTPPSNNAALKNAHGQQIPSLATMEEQMRQEVFYIDTSSKPVTSSIFQSAEFVDGNNLVSKSRPSRIMRRF